MNKTNRIAIILVILSMLFNMLMPIIVSAKSISESEKVNLVRDHMCKSLLKIKGKDTLKLVAYVCYKDPETGIKYPAFCVEPNKDGIGTGAGDSYDVTLSEVNNPVLWRILYKGYCGSTYQSWGLECDDDLYYATKVAVHCFAEGVTPDEKYELPHRVGWGQEITLEDVQRRGAKVLDVARSIYNYAMTSNENYIKASVSVSKGSQKEENIGNTKYLVQYYTVTANKELQSYNISSFGFPNGTRILNLLNNDVSNTTDSTFKIAIPISTINQNIKGYINITEAKVKTFPVFYADSKNADTQNYIITDPTEVTTSRATLEINSYKSTLKIIKKDAESNEGIQGVTYNVKYADGTNIGNYTTDKTGKININNLKPGNIIVTEISAPSKYIVDTKSKNIILNYNETSNLELTNARKKGQIKIVKYDQDNKNVKLKGVEFTLFNESEKKIRNIYYR
ncbi:MAG: Cys-Gln thioester bond-forming surface protein [Clostridia bacterium]|nr:Cys-Gln thioester bond-forming surface protein [Clostridia bacterium]